ncbi:MAG: D-alanyl-D-alanine carboxypeptidase [Actinomycetota bacterium]|nr:D-alanyl-D-alanine carboxypeptidase [Actinomycetota bacterium]
MLSLRRPVLTIVLMIGVIGVGASPARAFVPCSPGDRPFTSPAAGHSSSVARWSKKVDRLLRGRPMGVALLETGAHLYASRARVHRIPASNQKLLLSMALLDRLGPKARMATSAWSSRARNGVIRGDLWISGKGDPSVTGGGPYGDALSFRPTRLGRLARRVAETGVKRISGRVMGATGPFDRAWYAPGWRPHFPQLEVALPTALTFEGNVAHGRHTSHPERLAARRMTKQMRRLGVKVGGRPGAGKRPRGLTPLATLRSVPLEMLTRWMNRQSSNFFAEVLGKRLGLEAAGPPGTIAKGANAIERMAASHGVNVVAHDSSGLSYRNRVSPWGLARLLGWAEGRSWGPRLRYLLPGPGEGTLTGRLKGVRVRAKTGTLKDISALSGWVWLRRSQSWGEFSILSRGMPKSKAVALEDRVVGILSRSAV